MGTNAHTSHLYACREIPFNKCITVGGMQLCARVCMDSHIFTVKNSLANKEKITL